MRILTVVVLGWLFLIGPVQAHEVSLIEREDDVSVEDSEVQENTQINEEGVSQEREGVAQDQEFDQINDFIDQEDEKMKGIKLLNLDLERASLELKKKEIEQKMAQLNKSEGTFSVTSQDAASDETMHKPVVKLISIFQSPAGKQAVLNVNGVNINVKEKQQIDGVTIKTIDSQEVIVQYADGDSQHLYFS